jgi:hypothetical protein
LKIWEMYSQISRRGRGSNENGGVETVEATNNI